MATQSSLIRFRSKLTLGVLAMLALGLATPTIAPGLHPNIAFYADWTMDDDHNGLDDALDADLSAGATGWVHVWVHYGKRPTEVDATLLRSPYGANRTFVFHHWDSVQAQAQYSRLTAMRAVQDVVAIEKVPPASVQLDTSARAIRVKEANGLPVIEGIDHQFGVHEDKALRGEGVVVAVVDLGVNNAHESLDDLDDDPLTADPKLVQRVDPLRGLLFGAVDAFNGYAPVGCVDPPDYVAVIPGPPSGHGTAVAGVAVGTGGPTHQFQGMAPQAKMVDVVGYAFGDDPPGFGTGLGVALDWMLDFNEGTSCYGEPGADRIDVATMSCCVSNGDPNAFLNLAVTDVVRAGITFTQAAGNNGEQGAQTLEYAAEGGIQVASADDGGTVRRDDDVLACSSSRGPRLPDGDQDTLDELRPDITAPGVGIHMPLGSTLNAYGDNQGTSFAAPHIAGVAALMLEANATLQPLDLPRERMGEVGAVPVRDVLQQTAQTKTAVGDCDPLQAAQAGKLGRPWNNGWGYGLVDAWAAVDAVDG